MNKEYVILVDEADKEIGTMEKMEAHVKGVLHRAFSICLFNEKGEMLLQKRASSKYHSPGLWTNACCSHPRVGETVLEAGHRRLMEELGIDTDLEKVFAFQYKARLDKGLIEHEYDHVLTGKFNGTPNLNEEEVEDWKFMSLDDIALDIKHNPDNWTEWFKMIMPKIQLYYLPIFA